jgi:ATP-dependent helicase/DNAse subunit B
VFVDGFTDFTRTEHEVLELLAKRAETLAIGLTFEADAGRVDLFTKARSTLEELERRHPGLAVEHLPRRAAQWAAMDHLERHLFASTRDVPVAADAEGLEIIAAAGTTHEIELVARRIKGLLSGDEARAVAPEDILVVFRSLGDTGALVREVFGQFGIPFVIGASPSLGTAPIAAGLVSWLRLDLEDWPFRRLLAALLHNYFRPAWPEWQQGRAATALARLVRELGIPGGRAELVQRVERLAAWAADELVAKRRLSSQAGDSARVGPCDRPSCRRAGTACCGRGQPVVARSRDARPGSLGASQGGA